MYSKSLCIISNIISQAWKPSITSSRILPLLATLLTSFETKLENNRTKHEAQPFAGNTVSALFMSQAIFRCKSNSNFTCQIWTNNKSETPNRLAFKSDAAWSLAIPEAWQLSWKAEINLWPGGCVWMKAKQLQVTWQDWNILNLKHPETSSGKAERNAKNVMPLFFLSLYVMISNWAPTHPFSHPKLVASACLGRRNMPMTCHFSSFAVDAVIGSCCVEKLRLK